MSSAIDTERLQAGLQFFKEKCIFSGVSSITASDLMSRLEHHGIGNILLIDCRSKEEQSVSRIPGALSVQDDILKAPRGGSVKGFLPETAVAYCTGGFRSGEFLATGGLAKIQQRFPSVKTALNLELSMAGWAHCGGLFDSPAGVPTKRVHTWGSNFHEFFPESYECVQEPVPSGAGRLRFLLCLSNFFDVLQGLCCCCCRR